MIGSKRDVKFLLRSVAKARGISIEEYRVELQKNIYVMKESDDQEVQEILKNALEIRYLHSRNVFTRFQNLS